MQITRILDQEEEFYIWLCLIIYFEFHGSSLWSTSTPWLLFLSILLALLNLPHPLAEPIFSLALPMKEYLNCARDGGGNKKHKVSLTSFILIYDYKLIWTLISAKILLLSSINMLSPSLNIFISYFLSEISHPHSPSHSKLMICFIHC